MPLLLSQINRGPVAVEGFILLSGYVTHYAYASKQYNSATAILRYYARRFGAVLFSYYATWLVMLILSIGACASGACISNDHMLNPVYSITRGALSLLMLQSFEPTEPYFPNGPAWTISTMGLLWLLYPFLRKLLQRPLAQRPLLLCVCACACTQMPIWAAFVATAGGVQVPPAEGEGPPTVERFYMTERMYLWLYHFPVFRLGDFTMGMALAELASAATSAGADNAAQALRRPIGWRGWGRASDACFMVLWVLCAFIPADPRSTSIDAHSGYEPLFVGAMQPLLGARAMCAPAECAPHCSRTHELGRARRPRGRAAGFMLFSTLDTTGLSHSARIMRHPIMSGVSRSAISASPCARPRRMCPSAAPPRTLPHPAVPRAGAAPRAGRVQGWASIPFRCTCGTGRSACFSRRVQAPRRTSAVRLAGQRCSTAPAPHPLPRPGRRAPRSA